MPVPIARADTRGRAHEVVAQTLARRRRRQAPRLDFGGANGTRTRPSSSTPRGAGGAGRASSSRVKPTGYSIFPDYDLLMQAG
jgi:hypothetical protein